MGKVKQVAVKLPLPKTVSHIAVNFPIYRVQENQTAGYQSVSPNLRDVQTATHRDSLL